MWRGRRLVMRAPLSQACSAVANASDPGDTSIRQERSRLLYLEGWPRWDMRFLDHALRRDQGLQTTLIIEAQLVAAGIKAD